MKIHFDYLVYAAYIQQSLCRDASPTFLCVVRTQRLQIIPKPFVRWMVNHQHESPLGTNLWHQD